MSLVQEMLAAQCIVNTRPSRVIEDDRIRVKVFKGLPSKSTPFPGRFLVLEFCDEQWEAVFGFHESKLNILTGLLYETAAYLGEINGPRRLRTVAIGDKRYFVDDRMMQLRNVDEPADFVDIPRGTPFDPLG